MWPFAGLSLTPNAIWLVPVFVGLYCCHLTPVLVRYRLRSDDARGALWLKRLADAVALFMKGAIPFTLISLSFAVYSTLAVRLRLPLRGCRLATLDAFIGFHWLQFLTFINSSKIASAILVFAYHSFVLQFVFLVAVLSFCRPLPVNCKFVSLYEMPNYGNRRSHRPSPAGHAFCQYDQADNLKLYQPFRDAVMMRL